MADNTVLTFFHVTKDDNPLEDNDENIISNWTNWCGPRVVDVGSDYLTSHQAYLISEALYFCQSTSDQVKRKSRSDKEISPGNDEKPSVASPKYVFQILGSYNDEIHFTWPPPVPTGDSKDLALHGPAFLDEERYSAAEYASLARSVISKPRDKSGDEAQTNCTKRYQSKHPMCVSSNFNITSLSALKWLFFSYSMRDGALTTIESVVISYQDITFVCFQTGGIFLNSKIGLPQVRIENTASMKRKNDDDEEIETDDLVALKRSRAHELGSHVGAPPGLNLAPWNSSLQNTPHSVSPTVASASAILGSFSSQSPQPQEQNGHRGQQQRFPAMPSPLHQPSQLNQSWTSAHNDNSSHSLHSPYYNPNASYPSVYSGMFQNDGRQSGGFMSGSINIPSMPSPQGNNGLQNLALASSSSYYSDYNPNQQYPGPSNQAMGDQKINNLQFIPRQRGESSTSDTAIVQQVPEPPVIHRVRKNDRNRICTSCGTTNSPGKVIILLILWVQSLTVCHYFLEWRKGPSGIKTLCNACGLRFSRAQARKAKKASKETDPAGSSGGMGHSGSGHLDTSGDNTPSTSYIPAPLQLPPGLSSAPLSSGSNNGHGGPGGPPHSPYMPLSDYQQHSGSLPPLPQSANSQQGGPSQQSQQQSSHHPVTHPGSTAPHYGGYGSFVGFTPYGEWSPASNSSFASQQGGSQGNSQGN